MRADMEKAEVFHETIELCLKHWGGDKLAEQTDAVFDCFVERKNDELAKTVRRINEIMKNNYEPEGEITVSDISGFVLKRYLKYLRG